MPECIARFEIEIDLNDFIKNSTALNSYSYKIPNGLILSQAHANRNTARANAYHLAKWHCTCGECGKFFDRNFK